MYLRVFGNHTKELLLLLFPQVSWPKSWAFCPKKLIILVACPTPPPLFHRSSTHNLSSSEIKAWKMKTNINHKFISFLTVHIYDLSYIHLHPSPFTVYCELTKWPASRWLDSSVGVALRRYCGGQRFESRSGLNIFFKLQFHNCLSCVYNCDDQS